MDESNSLTRVLAQVRQFVGALTLGQKLLLVAGTAMVAGTLWLFVGLLSKPKYVTLYSGLRAEEAQALGSRLAAKNIDYELSADGSSLLVPSDKIDASRLETASQGLPRNARLGFELFDVPNWAGSDFTEKVNFQRALEGELERTLQSLSEVEAVRVHLVLSRESLFTEREHQAKAAVIVKTRRGRLSENVQAAIPQLVASAVDELRPENVTVIDADTNTPLVQSRGPAGSRGAYNLDEELARSLVQTLAPVVGEEHVRASVHVEYDLSTSEDTQEIYDPTKSAALSTQKSEETAGGAAPGGIPGTASNVPGAAGNAKVVVAAANESQSSRSEGATYAVSKSVRHVVQPAGRVRRLTAAVLVDDAMDAKEENGKRTTNRRKRTAEEMKEIEQLARAAIGADEQRGDLLAIENLSFQEEPAEKIDPPSTVDRWRQRVSSWAGLLRYVGVALLFLVVYGLILRPVKKQLVAAFKELPSRLTMSKDSGADIGDELAMLNLPTGVKEAKRAAALKQQLVEKVRSEPAVASRLVQGWIREGEGK